MLQLSRAVQGVGGAIMFSVSLALLADAFRGKDRGIAFGVWGAITGLAVAIGPLLGGDPDVRPVLAVDLLRQPAGRDRRRDRSRRCRWPSPAPRARRPDWAGFVAVHRRAVEPGLRADRVESALVQRRPRASAALSPPACCWSRSFWWSARIASPMFDLIAVPVADVQRRLGRRLRHQRVDLRDVPVPGPVPAGHPGLQRTATPAFACWSSPAASWSRRRSPGG